MKHRTNFKPADLDFWVFWLNNYLFITVSRSPIRVPAPPPFWMGKWGVCIPPPLMYLKSRNGLPEPFWSPSCSPKCPRPRFFTISSGLRLNPPPCLCKVTKTLIERAFVYLFVCLSYVCIYLCMFVHSLAGICRCVHGKYLSLSLSVSLHIYIYT